MKKLAEHLENLNMIKESSWEKKWIKHRQKQGLPTPTMSEYQGAARELLTPKSSTVSGKEVTLDMVERNKLKLLNKLRAISPSLDYMKNPAVLEDPRIRKILNTRFTPSNIPNWAPGSYRDRYNRILASRRVYGGDNLSEVLQDMGREAVYYKNKLRDADIVTKEIEAVSSPLHKILKKTSIKDPIFKTWVTNRGVAQWAENPRELSEGVKIFLRDLHRGDSPPVFFSKLPYVSAGYAAPGSLFQIADSRYIHRKDPWSVTTPHVARVDHPARLLHKLKNILYNGKDSSSWERSPLYEGVTRLDHLLEDPASQFHLITKSPMRELGANQLLREVKVAPVDKIIKATAKAQEYIKTLPRLRARF